MFIKINLISNSYLIEVCMVQKDHQIEHITEVQIKHEKYNLNEFQ